MKRLSIADDRMSVWMSRRCVNWASIAETWSMYSKDWWLAVCSMQRETEPLASALCWAKRGCATAPSAPSTAIALVLNKPPCCPCASRRLTERVTSHPLRARSSSDCPRCAAYRQAASSHARAVRTRLRTTGGASSSPAGGAARDSSSSACSAAGA